MVSAAYAQLAQQSAASIPHHAVIKAVVAINYDAVAELTSDNGVNLVDALIREAADSKQHRFWLLGLTRGVTTSVDTQNRPYVDT